MSFSQKYVIQKKLMDSSSSKIYIVLCIDDSCKYVCKRIMESKFRKEEIDNVVESDNVVSILEHYHVKSILGNYYYLIMDYYPDAIDVFDYFCDKRITESIIKPFIKEMALAIKDCHDNGIVHLDVKGENFIIVQWNPLKLKMIDFGASHRMSDNNVLSRYFGTLLYCSPEIKMLKYCYKSDVWSLGAFIYYMICDKQTLVDDKVHTQYYVEEEKCFSHVLKKLLIKMLSYNPDSRPTIDEVLEDEWFSE